MKTNSPTHEEVTQRAEKIWQAQGNPDGRDLEIWLEAERQLVLGTTDSNSAPDSGETSRTGAESTGATALAERVKAETASESAIEFLISPPISEEDAVKAALQTKAARAPKLPRKFAPKAAAPVSGKPLWDKPHSS